MDDRPTPALDREEWTRRYAARVMERTGMLEHQAMEVARVGRQEFDREIKTWGDAILTDPEECADEEMSYWENDA